MAEQLIAGLANLRRLLKVGAWGLEPSSHSRTDVLGGLITYPHCGVTVAAPEGEGWNGSIPVRASVITVAIAATVKPLTVRSASATATASLPGREPSKP
jgi:hypothetical protein